MLREMRSEGVVCVKVDLNMRVLSISMLKVTE